MVPTAAAVLGLFIVSLSESSHVPVRFGAGGIYPCRCNGSDTYPSNCNKRTGACTGPDPEVCVNGARYGTSDLLGNCQIESIAFGKAASQVSTVSPFNASLAVDGRLSKGSCTLTANKSSLCSNSTSAVSWWQVDLGEMRAISAVWLLKREIDNGNLSDVAVRVSTDSNTWQSCYTITTPARMWNRQLCERPLYGRYVRVEKDSCSQPSGNASAANNRSASAANNESALSLCEVLVIDQIYIAASVSSLTSSSITISVEETFYKEEFEYMVTLNGSRADMCSGMNYSMQTHTLTGNMTTINNLDPLWNYKMAIQPIQNASQYGPPTSFNFTTTGAEPQAPSNLTATNITDSSAVLQWDAVPCEDWRGSMRQYQIDIPSTQYRNMTQAMTSLLLSSLQPSTTLTVSIRSVNEYGVSIWRELNFTTAAARTSPTGPPAVTTREPKEEKQKGSNKGGVIGGSIAAAVVAITVIVVVVIMLRKRKGQPSGKQDIVTGEIPTEPGKTFNNNNRQDSQITLNSYKQLQMSSFGDLPVTEQCGTIPPTIPEQSELTPPVQIEIFPPPATEQEDKFPPPMSDLETTNPSGSEDQEVATPSTPEEQEPASLISPEDKKMFPSSEPEQQEVATSTLAEEQDKVSSTASDTSSET